MHKPIRILRNSSGEKARDQTRIQNRSLEITEDTIREVALPLGLVDIKVCAVDEVWSGLKLVIRKENRPHRTPTPSQP